MIVVEYSAMPSREREATLEVIDKKPFFEETIGGTKRVGILSDGTWAVGWQQTNLNGRKRLVWHHHKDFESILNQNSRVIRSFLGIPLVEEYGETEPQDPNLGNLSEIRNGLIIPGENENARDLSRRIESITARVLSNRISSESAREALGLIHNRLGRTRNLHKVNAREHIASSLTEGTEVGIEESLLATEEMLKRAQEGTDIVRALLTRGTEVLGWADNQEILIAGLRYSVGKALIDIETNKVTQNTREDWGNFYDKNGSIEEVWAIKGKPYVDLREEDGIQKLRAGKDILVAGSLEGAQRLFQDAYYPLLKVQLDKNSRIKSDKYKIYSKR